jgi:hypothetical protein
MRRRHGRIITAKADWGANRQPVKEDEIVGRGAEEAKIQRMIVSSFVGRFERGDEETSR